MFKNPFSFEGRIRRLEYGLSYIIYFIGAALLGFFLGIYEVITGVDADNIPPLVILFLFIPLIWFLLAQGAKRCHDRGNSGIWQIIPFYGLWMLFADGEIGLNEYGPNPKHLVYEYFPEEQGKGDGDLQMNDTAGKIDILDKKD